MGTSGFDWADCWCLVRTLDYDSPLMKSIEPKTWFWRNPSFDLLMTAVELLTIGNVQRGNQSKAAKSKFPKRVPRPWDKGKANEKKLGGRIKTTAAEMWDWIEKRRGN